MKKSPSHKPMSDSEDETATHKWHLSAFSRRFLLLLYFIASCEFLHFYVEKTRLWIRLPDYLAGTERLPYQTRVLPIAFLWPILHRHEIMTWALGHGWALQPFSENAGIDVWLLWSALSFAAASFYCVRLYRAVSSDGRLTGLALAALLFTSMWSFTIHVYHNSSYTYDFSSLAFMTAGVFYIYQRKFLPLVVVMLLGTLNRETTLFLVLVFVVDAMWRKPRRPYWHLPWLRAALLLAVWASVWVVLRQIFAHNDRSEAINRFALNFKDLIGLRQIPAMLNMCGYLMPVIWLFRKHIGRFGSYAAVFPLWLVIMTWKGMLVESRVHGEWSGYVAVASVLLLEKYLEETKTSERLQDLPQISEIVEPVQFSASTPQSP